VLRGDIRYKLAQLALTDHIVVAHDAFLVGPATVMYVKRFWWLLAARIFKPLHL
jgi:hypothetical protein